VFRFFRGQPTILADHRPTTDVLQFGAKSSARVLTITYDADRARFPLRFVVQPPIREPANNSGELTRRKRNEIPSEIRMRSAGKERERTRHDGTVVEWIGVG
jgi:hypothetical protein